MSSQRYDSAAASVDRSESPAPPRPRRRRKMQAVTMHEVAARAAVSPSTVSLFLRRPSAVSPEAGRAIARAIDDLGYVPNLVAGGLAAAGSRVVSVVVPSVRNAFFAETVAAIERGLTPHGLQVLLGHSDYAEAREEALVRAALSWSPAAIVLTGLDHGRATRDLLRKARVPVIEMWELGGPPIDVAVGFRHREAGAMAARALLDRGRTRLAYLGARLHEDRRAARRAEGFRAAAEAAGVQARVVSHPAAASTETGGLLLDHALRDVPGLDGVACSNDVVALGALFEAQRRGVAAPEALSLVGFGDLGFAASCNPALTTIRPAADLIGAEVARLVLARAAGEAPGATEIDTGCVFVNRRSV
jgi:LacI family gluconate utilization system Gnt-I transcriptional repressor